MKKINVLLMLVIIVTLSACKKDEFIHKTIEGTPPVFEEEQGYYNESPSFIQTSDNELLVFYTTNKEKNVSEDVIAFRKGTLEDGNWIFSDRTIILEPTTDHWDSNRVSDPDVIKGTFNYGGKAFDYLMAYQGNNIEAEKNYQVGLAVAEKPEGPWIKVSNDPFVEYDQNIYGSQFGAGQPSLVSYDNAGKVRLFYTFADELLTSTRVQELDLSNINNPIGKEAYLTLSVSGLIDKSLDSIAMLNNADFATSNDGLTIYTIRDRNPYPTIEPVVADSMQLAKANLDILYSLSTSKYQWTILSQAINDSYTFTEDQLGWQRMYSGCIITDEYGHISSENPIKIGYTSSSVASSLEDETYKFSSSVHYLEISDQVE